MTEPAWMPPRPPWLLELAEDGTVAPCWKPGALDDGTPAFERCDGALVYQSQDPEWWFAGRAGSLLFGPRMELGPEAAVRSVEESCAGRYRDGCVCQRTGVPPIDPGSYLLGLVPPGPLLEL